MSDEIPVEMPSGDAAPPARNAIKRGRVAAIAVAALAAGVIAYKELGARTGSAASTAPAVRAPGSLARAGAGSVLLCADPGEAGSSCGCGEIIRLVRAARERGVAIREIAPVSDAALERAYRVTVAPTVLFLDSSGGVVARHEGEAQETIESIRAGLDGLTKRGR